jgi:hypothetical protein
VPPYQVSNVLTLVFVLPPTPQAILMSGIAVIVVRWSFRAWTRLKPLQFLLHLRCRKNRLPFMLHGILPYYSFTSNATSILLPAETVNEDIPSQ